LQYISKGLPPLLEAPQQEKYKELVTQLETTQRLTFYFNDLYSKKEHEKELTELAEKVVETSTLGKVHSYADHPLPNLALLKEYMDAMLRTGPHGTFNEPILFTSVPES